MRAVLIEQTDSAGAVAEGYEVLAQQAHAQRIAVGLRELLGGAHRHPVAAKHLAHGRAGPDSANTFILLMSQHNFSILVPTPNVVAVFLPWKITPMGSGLRRQADARAIRPTGCGGSSRGPTPPLRPGAQPPWKSGL